MVAAITAHQPQYDLYIRRRDRALKLINRATSRPTEVKESPKLTRLRDNYVFLSDLRGLYVLPSDNAIGVYLMPDEIHIVEELPS